MLLRTPSKTGRVRHESRAVPLSGRASYTPVDTVVSFVPDELFPWPEEEIRRIRVFDPGFVPVIRRKIYKTSGGSFVMFRHHGVARYDRYHAGLPAALLVGALRPTSGFFATFPLHNMLPNRIERWFYNPTVVRPGSPRHLNTLPPPFIPVRGEGFDGWMERWARETYWAASAVEKERFIDEHGEVEIEKRKNREFEQAEGAYRAKGEEKVQRDLIAQLGPADEKEQLARQRGEYKEDPTPFVHVRGVETSTPVVEGVA